MDKMVPLSDLCEVFIGKTPSRSNSNYWGSGFNWLSIADMSKSSKLISESKEQITAAAVSETGIKLVPKNTVIFSFKLSIGKVAITEIDLFTNEAIAALHIKDSNILITEYLAYAIEIVLQTIQTDRAVMGATLNKYKINQIKIPLPSIEEQKRIAEILDRAEALKQKREQALAMADEYLRATFLDLFGFNSSEDIERKPMTEVFDIKTGKLNSNAAVEGGKYPFFTCAKEWSYINHFAFEQEALMLAGNNASADYDVKHYNGKFNAYQRTYVLTLKDEKSSYEFFRFALELQLQNLKKDSKGSNTKYITLEIMRRTLLPVPSPSAQAEFGKIAKKVEALKAKMQTSETEIEHLAKSLSQKAFRGELTSSVKEL